MVPHTDNLTVTMSVILWLMVTVKEPYTAKKTPFSTPPEKISEMLLLMLPLPLVIVALDFS
jgi:hypothetical protein